MTTRPLAAIAPTLARAGPAAADRGPARPVLARPVPAKAGRATTAEATTAVAMSPAVTVTAIVMTPSRRRRCVGEVGPFTRTPRILNVCRIARWTTGHCGSGARGTDEPERPLGPWRG